MNPFKKITLLSLLSSLLILISGCTTIERNYPTSLSVANEQTENKALSTKWGENLLSVTQSIEAHRLSQTPSQTTSIYYQSGVPASSYSKITRIKESPVQISILTESRNIIPLYYSQNNQYLLYGKENERYIIFLHNTSSRKIYEAIITVDGLDVISGTVGSYENRGYLLRSGETLFIEGFRKNDQQVAAFRFSLPDEGYVNYNVQGDKRNIGVIGVALFESEEGPEKIMKKCSYLPNPFPKDNNYAPDPCIP
ncbi:hypothetical protein OSB94_04520 [Proteus vulgaris]|uniref:hypothetical protein n=1 Tax=Proteus TaxID=583 RepID=UPI000D6987B7|nr:MULTISPECIES: hypothetical protein [Proteus]MBQ0215164.1 hypothetical protein [Proteus vulgaris]MDS0787357.1 hypothetical protein [Proteus vulgaris]UDN37624.1 hypothetical protein LG402_08260 [Proteus sp. NMG38-2]